MGIADPGPDHAVYAHALSLELDPDDHLLVMWQTDTGLASRFMNKDAWGDPILPAEVVAPETPAEFGPGREIQATALIRTGVTAAGEIVAGRLIPYSGMRLAFWSGTEWSDAIAVLPAEESTKLQFEASMLEEVTAGLPKPVCSGRRSPSTKPKFL